MSTLSEGNSIFDLPLDVLAKDKRQLLLPVKSRYLLAYLPASAWTELESRFLNRDSPGSIQEKPNWFDLCCPT